MLPRLQLQSGHAAVYGAGRRICSNGLPRPALSAQWRASARRHVSSSSDSHKVSSSAAIPQKTRSSTAAVASLIALGGLAVFSLSLGGQHIRLDARSDQPEEAKPAWVRTGEKTKVQDSKDDSFLPEPIENVGVWFRDVATVDWGTFSDRVADFLLPEWSKSLPGFARKLQRELDSDPGSLAEEIWKEARDPSIHPEIQYAARVRVSEDLCNEEKAFRALRKKKTAAALAKYLQLPEGEEVHPDDVPVIALCGSGGGLRALVAGTGSLMAVEDAGLFDCVTYTAGVSGSCWLQSLFFASFTNQNFHSVAEHLRQRLGIHIAHPPEAFTLLTSAPTNKYLLSGSVERFKADPNAKFGLVDIYGTLLAARLLVPRGELGVSPLDFKISNQRRHLTNGENPMPIYTAVRHEIPELDMEGDSEREKNELPDSTRVKESPEEKLRKKEGGKEMAKKEAWFQWFEITPYEFFCEEFAAGIPTWAMGRKFKNGHDVPPPAAPDSDDDNGYRLPEVRMPLMLGIFGSAFCATLSHYYKEIRPIIKSFSGMAGLDEMIWGRNDDLSKVHPIEPAELPNPVYGMKASQLPNTVPPGLLDREHIQLMDAGMSNNLPLYPFMRPGRGVEVVLVFDASADIRKDNWLCVADGYARKRGVKGWPIGVGWPQPDETPEEAVQDLEKASAGTKSSGPDADTPDAKLAQAQEKSNSSNKDMKKVDAGKPEHDASKNGNEKGGSAEAENAKKTAKELGYCTVWVGSTEEEVSSAKKAAEGSSSSSSSSPDLAPPIDDSSHWRLSSPDAGLTLVYLPYLANEAKVPGVNPATSEYMSTWNFIYTPEEVDKAVALAKANFAEGAEQIRATVRAVYERKKQLRLKAALEAKKNQYRRLVQLGKNDKLDGDHFDP